MPAQFSKLSNCFISLLYLYDVFIKKTISHIHQYFLFCVIGNSYGVSCLLCTLRNQRRLHSCVCQFRCTHCGMNTKWWMYRKKLFIRQVISKLTCSDHSSEGLSTGHCTWLSFKQSYHFPAPITVLTLCDDRTAFSSGC